MLCEGHDASGHEPARPHSGACAGDLRHLDDVGDSWSSDSGTRRMSRPPLMGKAIEIRLAQSPEAISLPLALVKGSFSANVQHGFVVASDPAGPGEGDQRTSSSSPPPESCSCSFPVEAHYMF